MPSLQARLTIEAWRAADAKERAAAAEAIAASSAGALTVVRTVGAEQVPVLGHAPSQALFHLVPGGTWRLGFSREEWDAVFAQYRGWWEADIDDEICEDKAEAPDPYEVQLPAFLLAARPFDAAELGLVRSDDAAARERSEAARRKAWAQAGKLTEDKYIASLEKDVDAGRLAQRDFEELESRLRLRGLRLPTHDEWEAAARAGGQTPFADGSRIPERAQIGVNRFGFPQMAVYPEVVAGTWVKRPGLPPERALRGGAGMCYPGQDHGEWTLLLVALRTGAEMFEGELHVRPLIEIPDE